MTEENIEIIIYNTDDGKADVKLYSKDGVIWMDQQQMPRPKTPPQAGLTFLHQFNLHPRKGILFDFAL